MNGAMAPGCRADSVLIEISDPPMMPLRKPLRSLIYMAADRAVRDVYADGRQVVTDGKDLSMDHAAASRVLETARKRSHSQTSGLQSRLGGN